MAETMVAAGSGRSPFESAVALWHMTDERDAAGDCRLAAHGRATLGVRLNGEERRESLARGGDGVAARLNGGYLRLANDAALRINPKQWTILIRMCDPDGRWRYPILGSYGDDSRASIALRAVDGAQKPMMDRNYVGAECPTIYSWMFRPGGPRSVPGTSSLLEVVWGAATPNAARVQRIRRLQPHKTWPNPLQQDVFHAVMKPCFPVGLIGPRGWRDITVVMTGPKLQLWIDGVLVDEEYPVGVTRKRTRPFLIGAGYEGGELRTGFKGWIDHVAIWNRALAPAEIALLSGGAEHVRQRELAILGAESPSMQYFRPRGHNRKAGDCIPYWDERSQTFRLFYLILRRNMHSKWDGGHGGLEIWQASTQDLKTWRHHPVTIPITEQWEAWNGTGAVAFHDGKYHWFYPTPDYDGRRGGIQHAVSADGVHFTKQRPHPFLKGGDCEVFRDDSGVFHLIKAGPTRRTKMKLLRDKTLVAWVRLADLEQRGGSVLTIEHPDAAQFDGIVFGERVRRRWMPGSDGFRRTPPSHAQEHWPEETAGPNEIIQVAAVYNGKHITLYRNGLVYASCEVAEPIGFPSGSSLLIGKRHTHAAPLHAYFRGDVLDARVYDRALSAGEVAALKPGVEGDVKPLAWYCFADGEATDRMGRFPAAQLRGDARIERGALTLRHDGYAKAPGLVNTQVRLTSTDLEHWTKVPEPVIESDERLATCPNLFKFGAWYYYLCSRGLWRSRTPFGPWERHRPPRLTNLSVPKTAAFGRNRRIYAGFLNDGGWGGNEVLRELVQDADGWLGVRFVPEMIPACGEAIPVVLRGAEPNVVQGSTVDVSSGEGLLVGVAGDFRLEVEIEPGAGVGAFGVGLRTDAEGRGGCDLVFEPARRCVRFTRMGRTGAEPVNGPSIVGVGGLDKPFRLDIIARYDILDAEIGRFRTLTTRFWRPRGRCVRLFAEGRAVRFKNIRIRRIVDNYAPYPVLAPRL